MAAAMGLGLKRLRLGLKSVPGLMVYAFVIFIFLFLPISMIALFSFNSSLAGTFPLAGFTLRWYQEIFSDPLIVAAAQRSVFVALITSLISGVIGTLCALGLTRYNFKLKRLFWILLLLPMILPGLLLGVSLLTYFTTLRIRPSLVTVTISHIVFSLPYVVFIVYARLQEFDRVIEEVAQDLGATPWQTFRRVTFPLIASSIIGAMMIVFAWSFDDFIVTFFTIGPEPTLPIMIWGMLRRGTNPTLNAIATLVLTITLILLLVARRIGRVKFEF